MSTIIFHLTEENYYTYVMNSHFALYPLNTAAQVVLEAA